MPGDVVEHTMWMEQRHVKRNLRPVLASPLATLAEWPSLVTCTVSHILFLNIVPL
jgi:hypothetical protein